MKNNVGKIAIIGLGYVGLPLAVGLSKKYDVIGFDINSLRIDYYHFPHLFDLMYSRFSN